MTDSLQLHEGLDKLSLDLRDEGFRRLAYSTWEAIPGFQPVGLWPGFFADMPLVLNAATSGRLLSRGRKVCEDALALLRERQQFGGDVLVIDFMPVDAPEGGLDFRLIELQAFTSTIASIGMLAALWRTRSAALEKEFLFSDAHSWSEWQSDAWGRLGRLNTALVEHEPLKQRTAFDFFAAKMLFGTPILDWRDLLQSDNRPQHLHNRVVPATLTQSQLEQLNTILSQYQPNSIHSHPSGYYALSKADLRVLDLPPEERAVPASQWASLGVAPAELVLKAEGGFGGDDVYIGPSAKIVEDVAARPGWIAQRRFSPASLMRVDGEAVRAEIRLVFDISGQAPKILAQIGRMYRGEKASAGTFKGGVAEGLAVVFRSRQA